MSPELLDGLYDEKADIYAFGVQLQKRTERSIQLPHDLCRLHS